MEQLLVAAVVVAASVGYTAVAHRQVVADIAGLEEPCALILRGRRVQRLCLRRAGHILLLGC